VCWAGRANEDRIGVSARRETRRKRKHEQARVSFVRRADLGRLRWIRLAKTRQRAANGVPMVLISY